MGPDVLYTYAHNRSILFRGFGYLCFLVMCFVSIPELAPPFSVLLFKGKEKLPMALPFQTPHMFFLDRRNCRQLGTMHLPLR